jgi:broad specificity phosphatase PhoE
MSQHVRLLLLRHGRSEWNAIRRWQGSFDSPLDDLGRDQARAVAAELAALDVAWFGPTASALGRAAETAAIIARHLGLGEPRLDHRLNEAHAGEWQGLTPDEIEARYPGWLARHRRPTSFEPYDEVVARAVAAITDIVRAARPGSTALVVSHSGLIRSIVRSTGLPDSRVPNLGGVWLRARATERPAVHFDGVFDPSGPAVSGLDGPGEDPGEDTGSLPAGSRR